jgi:hypothetical protein
MWWAYIQGGIYSGGLIVGGLRYASFKDDMTFAILNSKGFGLEINLLQHVGGHLKKSKWPSCLK